MSKPKKRASKVRPVPIDTMIVPAAYIAQRPFIPSHGAKLAAELDLNLIGLPVINHRDGKHYICDGQHRVYALKQNGFEHDNLDCEVYENLTDEEMADIFLGRDDRKAVAPFVKFLLHCTAGHVRENDIRRVVEAHGLKFERSRRPNCITAVGALGRIYDTSKDKDIAVGWVVRIAKHAFNGDPAGFDVSMLDALGLVYNRYNGRLIERDLIQRLSLVQHGVRGLMQKAEATRDRNGQSKAQCLASHLIEIYNKGAAVKQRVAAWWKETAPDQPERFTPPLRAPGRRAPDHSRSAPALSM